MFGHLSRRPPRTRPADGLIVEVLESNEACVQSHFIYSGIRVREQVATRFMQ